MSKSKFENYSKKLSTQKLQEINVYHRNIKYELKFDNVLFSKININPLKDDLNTNIIDNKNIDIIRIFEQKENSEPDQIFPKIKEGIKQQTKSGKNGKIGKIENKDKKEKHEYLLDDSDDLQILNDSDNHDLNKVQMIDFRNQFNKMPITKSLKKGYYDNLDENQMILLDQDNIIIEGDSKNIRIERNDEINSNEECY